MKGNAQRNETYFLPVHMMAFIKAEEWLMIEVSLVVELQGRYYYSTEGVFIFSY